MSQVNLMENSEKGSLLALNTNRGDSQIASPIKNGFEFNFESPSSRFGSPLKKNPQMVKTTLKNNKFLRFLALKSRISINQCISQIVNFGFNCKKKKVPRA